MDILKEITDALPKVITDAEIEAANIVLYTDNADFFRTGESKIKELVNQFKKRIELRSAKKIIEEIIPVDAEVTNIIFDLQRSIVVIEAKKPGLVIGKQGSVLQEVKEKTLWSPK